jgi:hypothetical protein
MTYKELVEYVSEKMANGSLWSGAWQEMGEGAEAEAVRDIWRDRARLAIKAVVDATGPMRAAEGHKTVCGCSWCQKRKRAV